LETQEEKINTTSKKPKKKSKKKSKKSKKKVKPTKPIVQPKPEEEKLEEMNLLELLSPNVQMAEEV